MWATCHRGMRVVLSFVGGSRHPGQEAQEEVEVVCLSVLQEYEETMIFAEGDFSSYVDDRTFHSLAAE